ncbi:MAG: tetratricopeptide repeat protein [Leptospiraceae bacterium]|nr:tetratricopeptide repeat protein [Leptospiraceae bacterium]
MSSFFSSLPTHPTIGTSTTRNLFRVLFIGGGGSGKWWVLLLILTTLSSPVFARERTEIVYAFRNYERARPIKMILVGEIKSKIKAAQGYDRQSPYQNYDVRQDQVTVRVMNREGLRVGQKLYVIEKNPHHKKYRNGMIVAEITVASILNNPFYGWVITGQGNLLRVREGQFVARTLESENLEKARVIKKRGDMHMNRGEVDRAIAAYQDALRADRNLPEAHAALGDLYLEEAQKSGEYPVRALSAFDKAWQNREHFYYNSEVFQFCLNYMEALYLAYSKDRYTAAAGQRPQQHLSRIDEAAQVCATITDHPDCELHRVRADYYLMEFYSAQSSADQRQAYDSYRKQTGELLKGLEEKLYGYQEFGPRLKEYESGSTRHPESSFDISQYHGIAALYYARVLSDLPGNADAKRKEKAALLRMVEHHYEKAMQGNPGIPELQSLGSLIERMRKVFPDR